MRRILLRVLGIVGIILLLLVLGGVGGGYWFITKSLPQTNGTVQLPGLSARVSVIRDRNGVPHIYGDTEDDLFMAQGYVHAQDRLWQMELNRRIGKGQLAELFGADQLDNDKFLRTLGLARAAERDLAASDPVTRRNLEMYAAGVNAFIRTHQDNLPIEFTLLGAKPADWAPLDTLVWGKVMAFDLGGNYELELLRAAIIKEAGMPAMLTLIPGYPAQGPFIIPAQVKNFASGYVVPLKNQPPEASIALGAPKLKDSITLNALLGKGQEGIGSNNWVVDGTKTTTGKPLLANDPHLGIQMPSIWYVNALHCNTLSDKCRLNVIGYSFAGAPGVIIGHNDRIAWGVTNVDPDVQDLLVEKINRANPNQYEYDGAWQDMELVKETIQVKGAPDVQMTVRLTRHGPIMNDVLEGAEQPLALEWTATRETSRIFQAVRELNAAQNWEEFRAALRAWDVPSQNFVYADVDGNIGYQMPGTIPIRTLGDGTLPSQGWKGRYEWSGYIPFDELPSVYNPSNHFIVSANNQVVPDDYKYLLTKDWESPFRAERIISLIQQQDKLSPDDFAAMQADVYSLPLVKLQKYVAALPTDYFLTRRALDYVRAWDGRMDRNAQAPAILEATYQALVRDVLGSRLSPETFKTYQGMGGMHRVVLDRMLDDPQNEWWDDPATPERETRDNRLTIAYREGVDFLGKLYGDAPPEWRWGRIHFATFEHPFGEVKPLDLLFNRGPIPTNGHGFTINNAGYRPTDQNYAQRTVSSMRQIMNLADWDQSRWVITTGQSGQVLSPHYADQINRWRDVQYETLPFTRDAVLQQKAAELTLTP